MAEPKTGKSLAARLAELEARVAALEAAAKPKAARKTAAKK